MLGSAEIFKNSNFLTLTCVIHEMLGSFSAAGTAINADAGIVQILLNVVNGNESALTI
jgi:hypothetical protein